MCRLIYVFVSVYGYFFVMYLLYFFIYSGLNLGFRICGARFFCFN